jgi:FtsP/CotA-like multicopper oxidase with cupredoxin domain
MSDQFLIRRRQLLKAGAAGAGFLAMGGAGLFSAGPMAQRLLGVAAAAQTYIEVFPTSPLILNPFTDPLPIPNAARPVPNGLKSDYWNALPGRTKTLPAPAPVTGGLQDANGAVHQLGPEKVQYKGKRLPDPYVYHVRLETGTHKFTSSKVLPISSLGQPSFAFVNGAQVPAAARPGGFDLPASIITGFNADLTGKPVSFPGPRINAAYGQPVILRFENQMGVTAKNFDPKTLSDYGSPEMGFLTHLHNGHTACESDGQPHYRANQGITQPKLPNGVPATDYGWGEYNTLGYSETTWVDNMYLNFPAGMGGNATQIDDTEKQGLFWFHDHFHNMTGANVYKGMVGLFPLVDPGSTIAGRNFSDVGENTLDPNYPTLGLPGVYRPNGDGSFEMDYDIPLAFYDVRMDDGVTVHQDFHADAYNTAAFGNIKPGLNHPEWWGQSFFKHFPNHGFVGDIFTVNGTAFPVMTVQRRRYRFRTLDASISRAYQFQLMSSSGGPKAAKDLGYQGDELQGQYRLPDGQQCMKWLQIASGGGLLPKPILRDQFEIWPAMRREVVVDFSKYQDGSPTRDGDKIYWVNTHKMPDGRMPTSPDPAYKIPMILFVVDAKTPVTDNSKSIDQLLADAKAAPVASLRQQPDLLIGGKMIPVSAAFDSSGKPISDLQAMIDNRRQFTLQRGGTTVLPLPNDPNDNEWSINGHSFDQTINVLDQKGRPTTPTQGVPEIWEIVNGGGGWVHPMHMHMEEHHILLRNGKAAASWQTNAAATDPQHQDDTGKDDVVAMNPSESVMFYRNFRTFKGKYVAHCHNLAHEDHAMMFGWEII